METISHLQEPFKRQVVRRCPKCRSIFITKRECESCGYRLNFDKVGEPFGKRSFFEREELYKKIPPWKKLFGRRAHDRRLRKLDHRLGLLIDYCLDEFDGDEEKRNLFFIEIRAIGDALVHAGGERYLSKAKERCTGSSMPFLIQSLEVQKELGFDLKKWTLLMRAVTLAAILTTLALVFYPYAFLFAR